MTGFQAPNYTQVPNDYFDLVMEMTEAEIKIISVLIRYTFGYHRDEIKMSVRELANATQMSTSSVWIGAEKLEARGLIERSVSNNNTATIWTVVISDTKLYRQIVKTVSNDSDKKPVLPLKKEKKEIKEPATRPLDILDAILHYEKPAMTIRQAVTDYFKMNVNWDTKTARQWMEWAMGMQITSDQIKGAAEVWRTDKRFNWSAPTLQKIFEQWPALMGESIAEADPIYHAGIIELPAEPMTPEELRFIFGDANA